MGLEIDALDMPGLGNRLTDGGNVSPYATASICICEGPVIEPKQYVGYYVNNMPALFCCCCCRC
jgi:hypothetical protein